MTLICSAVLNRHEPTDTLDVERDADEEGGYILLTGYDMSEIYLSLDTARELADTLQVMLRSPSSPSPQTSPRR